MRNLAKYRWQTYRILLAYNVMWHLYTETEMRAMWGDR